MTNNPTTVQQAATIATAIANSLSQPTAQVMTPGNAASILGNLVSTIGPMLAPQFSAAFGLATLALSAIHVATTSNAGITPEQLAGLFSADDAAKAADAAAQVALPGHAA